MDEFDFCFCLRQFFLLGPKNKGTNNGADKNTKTKAQTVVLGKPTTAALAENL